MSDPATRDALKKLRPTPAKQQQVYMDPPAPIEQYISEGYACEECHEWFDYNGECPNKC